MSTPITPALHTPLGQRLDPVTVTEAIGEPLLTAVNARNLQLGRDYLQFTYGTAYSQKVISRRVTVKLGLDGGYIVELGRVDRSTSVPTYVADYQSTDVALDDICAAVEQLQVEQFTDEQLAGIPVTQADAA